MKEKKNEKNSVDPKAPEQNSEHKEAFLPDPKIEQMTREEAMEYFGLPVWASSEDLDKEFWKQTKVNQAKKDEQKLADLACAYNIANGTRDRKAKEAEEAQKATKFLGKSKKEWREFWYYEWWKFAIAIAAVIFLIAFLETYVLEPKVDFRLTSIGHFNHEETILQNYLTREFKYKNPDLSSVDVVADQNEEGEAVDPYATQMATSMLALKPEIMVYDSAIIPTYIYNGTLLPLDDLYAELQNTLPADQLALIEPFYYSRARFYEDYGEQLVLLKQELDELKPEDYEEHIYGLAISDRVTQLSLGYDLEWKNGGAIVFCVNSESGHKDKAVEITKRIMTELPSFRESYLEDHPFADADD